jgi:hypothetical protein
MLEEAGVEPLQDGLMASIAPPMAANTCESTRHLSLQAGCSCSGTSSSDSKTWMMGVFHNVRAMGLGAACILWPMQSAAYGLGQHSGQQTFSAPKLLPFRSTCSGARLSRNMRISPHMPPWRPGAPRMTASASLMSCSITAAVSPLSKQWMNPTCTAATLAT